MGKNNLEETSKIDQQLENIPINLPSYEEKLSEDSFDFPEPSENDSTDIEKIKAITNLDTSIVKEERVKEDKLDYLTLSKQSIITLKEEPKQRVEVQIPSTDTSEIHKEQEVSKDITEDKRLVEKVESSE